MLETLPYITKRHNKYGIRVRVPEDLQEIIGKKEITRSLVTGDPTLAKPIYHQILSKVQAEIQAAKSLVDNTEPTILTPEMAESFARLYFQEAIFHAEEQTHRVKNIDGFIQLEDSRPLINADDFSRHCACSTLSRLVPSILSIGGGGAIYSVVAVSEF